MTTTTCCCIGLFALLLMVGSMAAADQLDDVRSSFTYHGSPVHPGIVELFDPGLADSEPQVLAVDLAAAQGSNKFPAGSFITESTGWIRTRPSHPDDGDFFTYKFVGTLPSGNLVLHTAESGGGSGCFESVMIFSIRIEKGLKDDGAPHDELVLHLLRQTCLGDRANAVMRIEGARVLVDRSQAHDQDMRGPMVLDDPLPAPAAPAARP